MESGDEKLKSDKKTGSNKRKSILWLNRPKVKRVRPNSSAVSTPLGCDKSQKPSSCNLKRAPKEKQEGAGGISKQRQLFSNTQAESIVKEMCSIQPSFIQKVKQAGLMGDFCNFLRLVHENKLPLTNIALLLLFDVVRWYSLKNTCYMEYSDEAGKFWKVMYKLFHGKALRSIGGMKTPSENCDGNTQNTSINFAVPSQNRVASFDATGHELPKEIPAGIIRPALEMKDNITSATSLKSCSQQDWVTLKDKEINH